jgi:DNA repair exonuclease SbcCD ATPase subunit
MATETTGKRLDRIEEKLDKLTDAMVAIARTEEKMVALQDDHDNMRDRLNKHSEKLDEIERIVLDNNKTVCFIHKLFWVALVAATGVIATNLWM